MYDNNFQQHAKQALEANPFEPMVMVRTEKPYSAYDAAMPAEVAKNALYSKSFSVLPLL